MKGFVLSFAQWRGRVGTAVALLTAAPTFAATLTVTNAADSGAGSLRNTVATAGDGDTVVFALTLPATIMW